MQTSRIAAILAVFAVSSLAHAQDARALNPKLEKRPYAGSPESSWKRASLPAEKRLADASSASGSGSSTLGPTTPPLNDDCSTPRVVAGTGSFLFDNSNATTGTQGQGLSLCSFGLSAIQHDIWFTWTAPASACTLVDTCGSAVDTKLAVYSGAGCPLLSAGLACNDDACGLQSLVSFQASAGQTYTIQLGTFPGAQGGSGSFQITQLPAGIANDSCTQPTLIAGLGVFPFDNSNATTGCEGQHESLCAAQYGQFSVENDVWFQWVAPATGYAVCDTCGLTSVDTKLAAYLGAGCPTGSALACVDDSCPGNQATLAWPCTAGTTYTLQLGNFPGAAGGTGSFSMNVLLPPSNDSCSTPVALGASTGTFPFALFGATTGTQGQTGQCNFYGVTAIENDIWYTWSAPSSGRCTLSLCAGSSFDSKIAVYSGAGCPAGGPVACNDDACGLTSEVCFDVTGGATYTIQLGTFPGAGNNHSGSFDLGLGSPLPSCTYDDGDSENLLTWSNGGDMVWLNRFGAPGASTVVSDVAVQWGSAAAPGFNPGNGTPTDICIWQDGASQDGDPGDATLLLQIPTVVSQVDTDIYVDFPIHPLTIAGVFFVGTHQVNNGLSGAGPVQYVATMDTNCVTPGVAWFFGNDSGPSANANLANPGANVQAPHSFESIGLPCQVCVRAGCSTGPASYLCDPGVAGVHACPCANPPAGSMRGCDNSESTGGASIAGAGSNTLSNPTLVLTTSRERASATSVLLQGTSSVAAGAIFGQGVRCVSGSLKRLYVKSAVLGSILAPDFGAGDVSIPARSSLLGDTLVAGEERFYLVYYRDPLVLGACSASATFNATNTARVHWRP